MRGCLLAQVEGALPGPPDPAKRILFLDIETFPNLGWVWGKYEQNVLHFERQTIIASFAAVWLGGKVFSRALPSYAGYKADVPDDAGICADLHALLSQADVVVAHNGKDFDVRVINGRFICHRLSPPPPFKVVDTKLLARRVARFNSNRLDDVAQLFGLGEKLPHEGFKLWRDCMAGKPAAWKRMVRYNERDVVLLRKIYLRLLPWDKEHPNMLLYSERAKCPNCGSSKIHFRGVAKTLTRVYLRFQCQVCGAWGRTVKSHWGVQYRSVA